jgi:ABC-type antimicrobial peptide transport system permease subunit
VRIALGARRGDVLRLVLLGAARVIAAGSIVGLVAAALLGKSVAALLFAVKALDPMTFAAAAGLIALTAAAATVGPAWRASRVDPVVTFRNDQ